MPTEGEWSRRGEKMYVDIKFLPCLWNNKVLFEGTL